LIPLVVIVLAFIVFLLAFIWQSGGFRKPEGRSLLGEALQRSWLRVDDRELIGTWVVALIGLPIVLLESSASWPLRAALFGGVVIFLAAATFIVRRWGS